MLIKGRVKKGKGIGSGYGYPTANISSDLDLENGVYRAMAFIENDWLPAIFIKGATVGTVEVYVINWQGDLYGETIEVKIFDKIRDLIRFKTTEELVEQIKKDIKNLK